MNGKDDCRISLNMYLNQVSVLSERSRFAVDIDVRVTHLVLKMLFLYDLQDFPGDLMPIPDRKSHVVRRQMHEWESW